MRHAIRTRRSAPAGAMAVSGRSRVGILSLWQARQLACHTRVYPTLCQRAGTQRYWQRTL